MVDRIFVQFLSEDLPEEVGRWGKVMFSGTEFTPRGELRAWAEICSPLSISDLRVRADQLGVGIRKVVRVEPGVGRALARQLELFEFE